MKKHKSVISILLAIMMVFTFMPTMSFAASAFDPNNSQHVWQPNEAESIAPTCYSEGLTIYSCKGNDKLPQLTCEARKATYANPKTYHTLAKNPVPMSKDDLIKKLASDWGLDATEVKELYDTFADDCYAFAYECVECGRIPYATSATGTTYDGNTVKDANGNAALAVLWQGHKAPKDTPACAMSFVCEYCGQTVDTGVGEGSQGSGSPHRYGRWTETRQYVCGDANKGYGWRFESRTCSVCGHVQYRNKRWEGSGQYANPSVAEHGAVEEFVKVAPTCTEPGVKSTRCKDCGEEIPLTGAAAVIPKLGHDEIVVSVPATCERRAFTYKICSRCNRNWNVEYVDGSQLGHKYNVEVLYAPNCDAEGITRISCTNGCRYSRFASNIDGSHFKYVDNAGVVHNNKQEGYKIMFVGQRNEYYDQRHNVILDGAVEVADWVANTHDWGKFEDMQAADCEHGAIQAAKCKVCGHYDVHSAVETGKPAGHKWTTITQDPTCGQKAFSADICSVCGKTQNVKTFGTPKVGYGAKCDFSKWVVEKEATPFEEGTKKLICRNCEDDGHLMLVEVNGEFSLKEMGVTRASIAKKTIAAPKVKALKKKAKVTVKPVEGAVEYQVLVNGKVAKTIKGELAKAKTVKITKKYLKLGKKNTFKIRAINAEGVKATSKAKSVKIKKK